MTTQSLQKLEDRIRDMVGKTFLVNAVSHKVLSFRIDDDKLLIVSDKKWFPAMDVQHSGKFLETFLEADEEPGHACPATLPATVLPQPAALQSSAELKDIMMDNIRKVQADQEYIPQASEIANQVKTLIDLAKTEIAYNRIMRGN
ncbi:MAG: hypothetical protein JWP57_702 [Spirosoma sp.]|nr:hypothetical protein [Spirosoma sp.]